MHSAEGVRAGSLGSTVACAYEDPGPVAQIQALLPGHDREDRGPQGDGADQQRDVHGGRLGERIHEGELVDGDPDDRRRDQERPVTTREAKGSFPPAHDRDRDRRAEREAHDGEGQGRDLPDPDLDRREVEAPDDDREEERELG